VSSAPLNLDGLLDQLRNLIVQARQQALRAVDVVQVRTCWEMGRHIVEFEQGGALRAEYGAKLLPRLAERLTAEFGKGFDASNLRYMRLFYQAFPNCDALRHELRQMSEEVGRLLNGYRSAILTSNSSIQDSCS